MKRFLQKNDFLGELWLIKNDPKYSLVRPYIENHEGYARGVVLRQDRPCGMLRIDDERDEEGLSLLDVLSSPEQKEMPEWRTEVLSGELEGLLDLLREGGTAALAKRLGCTQRSVQLKLKALVEEGWHAQAQASLF